MQRGRRIAFDLGDVRIGVAVSDPDSILSSPITTLQTADKNLNKKIAALFQEYEPVCIYVGHPIMLDGSDGSASTKANNFVEKLRLITQIPIELVDERMSTISAARNLRDSGRNAKEAKSSIDMAAAVAILDFAIELEKRK
jgi:putative Holliday junction resolvase